MQLELKGGYNTEIAAAAAQRPKQVLVFASTGALQLGIGRDHVGRDEIVDGQSELTRGPTEAAPERKTSDAGGRIDTQRRGKSEALRLFVEVGQRGAGLDASRASSRIDTHRSH